VWSVQSKVGEAIIGSCLRTKIYKLVGSIPGCPCQQFFNPGLEKINKALSGMVKVICWDHNLQCRDSYKGVGCASTLPESILHKIIIIFISFKNYHNAKPTCLFRLTLMALGITNIISKSIKV